MDKSSRNGRFVEDENHEWHWACTMDHGASGIFDIVREPEDFLLDAVRTAAAEGGAGHLAGPVRNDREGGVTVSPPGELYLLSFDQLGSEPTRR